MANFCTLMTKTASTNQSNVKTCAKSSWCEDFAHTLTFPNGQVLVAF
jgi:hypothetical protein